MMTWKNRFVVKSFCLCIPILGIAGSSFGQTVSLTGAGATFPYPLYSKWFDEYRKVDPNAQINYQSIGSGGGIRQITEGTVDFGASDGPMTDEQIKAFKEKRKCGVLHFPATLGADVPTYNLSGVTTVLNFTPEALAGIFLGKITKWNDPEIAKANPDVKLPDANIVVVHRSDGSGTTYVWVDYLAKVSPEWKSKVGVATSVNWPVGLGGKGNEGVTGLVKQTPNSIGYVELVYAVQNKLPAGKVKNSAGKFVAASLESVTAAAAGAATNMPDDFRVSITNAEGADAYPIASFTWLLIPEEIKDQAKLKVIKAMLTWALDKGQEYAPALHYAPLPKEVVAKELKTIDLVR
jgi:phosphate transport system substrate-binding protein